MSIDKEIQIDDLKGQPCPREACNGRLKVLNTKPGRNGDRLYRFYGCNTCGCRPEDNKRPVPIEKSLRATHSPNSDR